MFLKMIPIIYFLFHNSFFSDLDVHNWAVIGGIDNSNQIGAVIRIVSHPLAAKVRGFYHKDITLVQMATSFQFDEFVQPICVGEVEPRVGDLCLIAGWSDTPSEGLFTFV